MSGVSFGPVQIILNDRVNVSDSHQICAPQRVSSRRRVHGTVCQDLKEMLETQDFF